MSKKQGTGEAKRPWRRASSGPPYRRAVECSDCCGWFYESNTVKGKCKDCNEEAEALRLVLSGPFGLLGDE